MAQMTVKTFTMLHFFQINAVFQNSCSSKNPKKNINQHKIDNNKKIKYILISPNQHIIIISEGLCETEDWSNDAENSALHHRNKWNYIKVLKYKTVLHCSLHFIHIKYY